MAPVEDATIGMDQNQIFYRNAEDQNLSQELRAAWKTLADGLFNFNQDDPETAIKSGHDALSAFRREEHADGMDDSILVITRALTSLSRRKEADRLLRERLAEIKKSGNKKSEGKALLGIAEVNADQRGSKKRDEAGVAAKAAVSIFEDLEEPRLQASALLVSAHIAIKAKSPAVEKRAASAVHDATRACEICKGFQDRRAEAACLHALASAHDIVEQHVECMLAAEAALDKYLEMNDPYAEAFELCCMAQWCQNYSRYDAAIAQVEDALHILQNAEKPSTCQELRALHILTQVRQAKGDDGTGSTNVVEESLKRFQQTENRTAEAAAMDMLLRGHCEKGEFDLALETAEKSRGIFEKMDDEKSEASMSVIISGLQIKLGKYDEALEIGRSVLSKVKEKGSTKQKLDLMMTLCEAHMARGENTDALECCNDMEHHFAAIGNVEGEAEALVSSGSLYLILDDLESGKVAASKAQVILSEEGNAVGEGRALRLLAEIYSKTGKHKAAIRAGERSRALLKGEENANDEAAMLFLVAQEAVQLAVQEGARVGDKNKAPKKQAREALDKADRYGKTAIKLCRDNTDHQGIMDTLGSALCTMSQVTMLKGDAAEAVGHAKEALVVFEKTNHTRNQGSSHLLLADAYRAQEKWKESQNSALSAIRQFKACDPPDESGEDAAQQIISAIKKHLAPAPQPMQRAQFQGSGLSPLQLQMMGGQDGEEEGAADGGGAVKTYQSSGPSLDVANLSQEVVLKKIMEVALALTGGDEADLEADTPLMEAGVTSSAAVSLRDELMKEIPGVKLPVTLIFDYPSPAAVVEMILESIG